MIVAFIRPLAPAVGHIIIRGSHKDGYIAGAVALCGYSTERADVDVAVVCGDTMADVDCKRCLNKAHGLLHTTINGLTMTEAFDASHVGIPLVKVS